MEIKMNNKNILVIGAGIMGSGITQVIAQSGMDVCIVDRHDSAISNAKIQINKSLSRLLKKGKIDSSDLNTILNDRIKWYNDLESALNSNDINLIIEAVPENEQLKIDIINVINKVYSNKDIIYASNTSSISITQMASKFYNPSKFIGMHFMNPVPVMKLVEIIPGIQTNDETIKFTEKFVKSLGKISTRSLDRAGFIANRILIPMINEGFFALMENLGTPEDIDKTMKFGCNQPIGPLALADLIGLDTCLHVINILHKELGDDKYRACPLLKQYVSAGWLGRKTKKGVFVYE
jgi:3-hydroxybutyryl-CoA dehydrogenase